VGGREGSFIWGGMSIGCFFVYFFLVLAVVFLEEGRFVLCGCRSFRGGGMIVGVYSSFISWGGYV